MVLGEFIYKADKVMRNPLDTADRLHICIGLVVIIQRQRGWIISKALAINQFQCMIGVIEARGHAYPTTPKCLHRIRNNTSSVNTDFDAQVQKIYKTKQTMAGDK